VSTKRKIAYGLLAVLLLFAGAAAWMLGPALLPARSVDAGIALGAKAPIDLPLRNAKGEPTTLAAQMGDKGLVLFFTRSVDWCPFCKAQMIRTEDIRSTVAEKGYGLASVSYDKPEQIAAFAQVKGIGFAMLSDQQSALIDAMALRDPQYGKDSPAFGVPRSAVVILARDGRVIGKFVDADYRSRQSNEQVLAMIGNAKP
jgi:peroxiredoxin